MNTPWAIVLCQFKDDLSPFPSPLHLYQRLFTATDGSFNVVRYFHDMSYGRLDLSGSRIFGPVVVGANHSDYTPSGAPGWVQTVGRGALVKDIRDAAASAGVRLGDFFGLVAIFNVAIGIPFGGVDGSPFAVADDRWVRNNGSPPFAHEMGHGYGLSHSRFGAVDEPAGEKFDYQDPWDMLSYARVYFSADPDYVQRGPGLNAWNMRSRGWLDESRVWKGGGTFDELVRLRPHLRPDLQGFLAADLPPYPAAGPARYLVELRVQDGWDGGIPQSVVLVHRFSQNQSYLMGSSMGHPALTVGDAIDLDDGAGGAALARVEVVAINDADRTALLRLSAPPVATLKIAVTAPHPVSCMSPAPVEGVPAHFVVADPINAPGIPLQYIWTIDGGPATTTDTPAFEAVMPSPAAPVTITVRVVVDVATVATGSYSFTPLTAKQVRWAEFLCQLRQFATTSETFRKAAGGVGEHSPIFVDPLWDPTREVGAALEPAAIGHLLDEGNSLLAAVRNLGAP